MALVGAALATLITISLISSDNVAPQDASALVQGRLESGYRFVGYILSDKQKVCAATLVDSETIVTAGHCLSETAGNSFNFGIDKFSPDSDELATIREVKFASGFDPKTNSGPDLAVAKLSKKFKLENYAKLGDAIPGCGYSIVAYGSGIQQGVATVDQFRKKSGEGCLENPTSTFLLKFPDEVGMCYGDSGGPIFASKGSDKLVGILAGGLVEKQLDSLKCDVGNIGVGVTAVQFEKLITDYSRSTGNATRQFNSEVKVSNFQSEFNKKLTAEASALTLVAAEPATNEPTVTSFAGNIAIYALTFIITLACIYFLTKPLAI